MYFTDTPELRKFEREMRQKPNFYWRNDDNENDDAHFSDDKNPNANRKRRRWIDHMKIKIRSPT